MTGFGQDTDDIALDVTVQRDGRIATAGVAYSSAFRECAIIRYQLNGSLDATFGNGGRVGTLMGYGSAVEAIAEDPDGKLVITGYAFDSTYNPRMAIARYTVGGALDASYGSGGISVTEPGTAYAFTFDDSARVIAAGTVQYLFGVARFRGEDMRSSIAGGEPETAGQAGTSILRAGQPSPNPARRGTTLSFELDRPASVTVGIFDVSGRRVGSLLTAQFMNPGAHAISWDGATDARIPAAPGVYFIAISSGGHSVKRRIVVLGP